jgi:putative Mg2+ transporter-C (MgtC) family protein
VGIAKMDVILTPIDIIVRLTVSALIGFIVGLNREKHSSAGVRTHMILAVGVCVITLVQVDITAEIIKWNMQNPDYIGAVSNDIARLTAQIVSGIGFLGAGLILVRNQRIVDGMTSAVSLWTVASISIAVGYGEYVIGLLGAGFLIITLTILNLKATRFGRIQLKVHFKEYQLSREEINDFLKTYDGKIVNYTMENIFNNEKNEYRYVYAIEYRGFIDRVQFLDSFIQKYQDIIYIELI